MGKIVLNNNILSSSIDLVLDSGSTNGIANSAVTVALDNKLDKQNFVNHLYPKGSIYVTYDDNNPSNFLGGQWELISKGKALFGVDENDPDFASGTTGGGKRAGMMERYEWQKYGATGNLIAQSREKDVSAKTFTSSDYYQTVLKDVGHQYTTIGNDLTYGGGLTDIYSAPVSVKSINENGEIQDNALPPYITVYVWKRIDDASMIEAITPLEYSAVKDVLWSGSATGITAISLSGSMLDYDTIEFKVKSNDSPAFVVYNVETDQIVDDFIVPISWDASVNRFYLINNLNADKSSYTQNAGNCTLLQVRGIKTSLIPSTRPYHSVKKLNPTITWGWPALQTDAGTELWEEVTGKHHTVRGSVKCLWSGGSQAPNHVLTICTLANIPLPSTPSLVIGGIYSSATNNDNCTGFLYSNGTLTELTMADWTDFAGWTMVININFEWDD